MPYPSEHGPTRQRQTPPSAFAGFMQQLLQIAADGSFAPASARHLTERDEVHFSKEGWTLVFSMRRLPPRAGRPFRAIVCERLRVHSVPWRRRCVVAQYAFGPTGALSHPAWSVEDECRIDDPDVALFLLKNAWRQAHQP